MVVKVRPFSESNRLGISRYLTFIIRDKKTQQSLNLRYIHFMEYVTDRIGSSLCHLPLIIIEREFRKCSTSEREREGVHLRKVCKGRDFLDLERKLP